MTPQTERETLYALKASLACVLLRNLSNAVASKAAPEHVSACVREASKFLQTCADVVE